MAKKAAAVSSKRVTVSKGTSIGNGIVKTSSMNKNKKASYKKYRGQGR